jgi:hypothetical protein
MVQDKCKVPRSIKQETALSAHTLASLADIYLLKAVLQLSLGKLTGLGGGGAGGA